MMWNEFEELAGYRVIFEDYTNIIEPMYNATDLSKQEFIQTLNRERFEYIPEKTPEQIELENNLKAELNSLKDDIEWYKGRIEDYKSLLESECDEKCIKSWKTAIKNSKEQIKIIKSRVQEIKWVLN